MRELIIICICICAVGRAEAQTHWESIVLAGDVWRYLPATSEPPSDWTSPGFDDQGWQQGPGGIGYADGDDATMISNVNSLYLRRSFSLNSDTLVRRLFLDIDYDDAFVAYLNGVEFARSPNVTEEVPAYNSVLTTHREAEVYSGGEHERYLADTSLLVEGENVLAVHILNNGIGSSDLTSLIYLQGEISGNQEYYSATPSWFDPPMEVGSSRLPIIVITTVENVIPDDPRIEGHMGVIHNDSGALNHRDDPFNEYDGRITIETRGQSSQDFPKKSYRLETQDSAGLNLNIPLLGMPSENDWILYAPYSDKSMLRNVITFEMGRKLAPYCTRTVFCELFLNGEYQGVYVLMEKIKRDDGRVNIDPLWPADDSGDQLTGGYIFKVDKIDADYVDGISGFTSRPDPSYPNAKDIIYQYFDPRPDELIPVQRNYLKDRIIEAEAALISGTFDDPEIGYNRYLNTSSFVDFMLLNEVTKEVDKYRYSSYFYKKKESKGGEIYAGPPWDFNLGYGNMDYWNGGLLTNDWLYESVHNNEWSIIFWWKRLMEDPFFEDLATSRWESLRSTDWSDANIQFMIDSITGLIDEAQQRNYEKWPILGVYVWPNYDWENNTYQDEVDYFSNWIFSRLEWMDNNFAGRILSPSVEIESAGSNGDVVHYRLRLTEDQFTNQQLRRKYFDLVTNNPFLFVDTVYYEDATTARIALATGPNATIDGTEFSVEIDDNILNGFSDLLTPEQTIQTGTYDLSAERFEEIRVYAAGSQIIIRTTRPGALPGTFSIINMAGRVVGEYRLEQASYNQVEVYLPVGVYVVNIRTDAGPVNEKVILTR